MDNDRIDHTQPNLNQRYLSQNLRILKLIKSKMQPLQKSRTTKLLLPKIKQKQLRNQFCTDQQCKRYVEIEIKDQEDLIAPSTEIQEEHRFNIEEKRINYRHTSKKRTTNILQSLLKWNKPSRFKKVESLSSSHRFNCVTLDDETIYLDELSLRQEQILREEHRNKEYLSRLKRQIEQNKQRYLNNIKLSEYIDEKYEKQNYTFEYLVNRIQTSKDKDQKVSKKQTTSAYQFISPNKIPDYLQILQPTVYPRLLSIDEDNKISTSETKPRNNKLKKKTTMMPHQPDKELEHVSAKLRIKANHKRLIDINK